MRLTIIPSDNIVNIDGKALQIDCSKFSALAGIHAVQWDGTRGHIEYVQGNPNAFVHNTPLTSIDAYNDVIEAWNNRRKATQ
jgi:hypothetical protein